MLVCAYILRLQKKNDLELQSVCEVNLIDNGLTHRLPCSWRRLWCKGISGEPCRVCVRFTEFGVSAKRACLSCQ